MDGNHVNHQTQTQPASRRILKFKNRYFVKFRGSEGEEKYHVIKLLTGPESRVKIGNRGADISSTGCKIITKFGRCPSVKAIGSAITYSNYFIDLTRANPKSQIVLSNQRIILSSDVGSNIKIKSCCSRFGPQVIPTENNSDDPTLGVQRTRTNKPKNVHRNYETNLPNLNQDEPEASGSSQNSTNGVKIKKPKKKTRKNVTICPYCSRGGVKPKNFKLKHRMVEKRAKIKIKIQSQKQKLRGKNAKRAAMQE